MQKRANLLIISLAIILALVLIGLVLYFAFKDDNTNNFDPCDKNKDGKVTRFELDNCKQSICGDGICDAKEKADANLCPKDCFVNQTNNLEIPYYFIAIHNEPYNNANHNTLIAKAWLVLEDIINHADMYDIKITIMLSASWQDYIYSNSNRVAELERWKANGHEIAGHHHDLQHTNWDGYTSYSLEEAEAQREAKGITPETYFGTLNDFIAKLKKINTNIHSGCMNDESDKNALPDEIIYDTCSGFANFGEVGTKVSDGDANKGKNEFVLVGTWNDIRRKWLSHAAVRNPQTEEQAESVFGSMNSGVYGVIAHSVDTQADALYDYMEFLHSKDANAQNSKTVSEIIDEKLLPEKQISSDLLQQQNSVDY